jgi:hypothetical protein
MLDTHGQILESRNPSRMELIQVASYFKTWSSPDIQKYPMPLCLTTIIATSAAMGGEAISLRLAVISSHQLVQILTCRLPVRNSLLSMLRPMEILGLIRATFFCIQLTEQDSQVFMRWWRQAFYTVEFAERGPSTVIVFGKDIFRLKSALERWDYFDVTQIKLLVIVDENPGHEDWTVVWKRRREVLRSVSTNFVWDLDISRLSGKQGVETSVVFFTRYRGVSFDNPWSKILLDCTSQAWYANLRNPDTLIQQTVSDACFEF